MSDLVGKLRNPKNGKEVPIYEGYSWSCLCFWFFWYFYRGMWGWGIISLLMSGLGWLVLPFFANKQYRNFLLKQGYVFGEAPVFKECLEVDEMTFTRSEDLLDALKNYSPRDFEEFVLIFLKKIFNSDEGYVTQESRDGGIDGCVKLNKMGLGDVPFQAKRFDSNTVGRPEIQKFIGALHGTKVAQAVFVTTSRYSKDARECAEQASVNLRLIDGQDIVELINQNNLKHLVKRNVDFSTGSYSGYKSKHLLSDESKRNFELLIGFFNSLPKWVKIVLAFLLFGLFVQVFSPSHSHRNVNRHSSNQ